MAGFPYFCKVMNSIALYIQHIFFTSLSANEHVGCFHVLAGVNKGRMNIGGAGMSWRG